MAGRIRTIKPEWLEDELLLSCSIAARLLSVGLILLADDYGNGRGGTRYIMARVGLEDMTQTEGALAELVKINFVTLYSQDQQSYFTIRNWNKHQRVDKPGASLVPGPNGELNRSSRAKTHDGPSGEKATPSPAKQASPRRPGAVVHSDPPANKPPAGIPEPSAESPENKPIEGIPEPRVEDRAEPSPGEVSRDCRDTAKPDRDLDLDLDQDLEGTKTAGAPARDPSPPTAEGPPPAAAHAAVSASSNGLDRPQDAPRIVFDAWLAGWRKHVGRGEEPTLTDSRRRLVRRQLREHRGVQLEHAARGVWLSQWHVDKGTASFENALRDAEHIERFAALATPKGRPAPKAIRQAPEPPRSGPAMSPKEAAAAAASLVARIGQGGVA